jgi:hypothetical protein
LLQVSAFHVAVEPLLSLLCALLQVKTKGTRKITFEQCLTALAAISEKKVHCGRRSKRGPVPLSTC